MVSAKLALKRQVRDRSPTMKWNVLTVVKEVGAVSHMWELREGKVLVVEDANTASLVVVARDLKDRNDKIAVLEEILRKLRP